MFQSCFLEQFTYPWCVQLCRVGLQGSCSKHHNGLCILGVGGGESVILPQAVPGQMLFNCSGPGVSIRGCSHWYLSTFDSLGTALLVVTFWFFYFVEESLLSVRELMSSGDQSREDEDKSICCHCWEDCSKIFLWEEKFLAYFCHLLLVLTLMQEIFIL